MHPLDGNPSQAEERRLRLASLSPPAAAVVERGSQRNEPAPGRTGGDRHARRELDHRRNASLTITRILKHIASASAGQLDGTLTHALVSMEGLTTVDRCFLAHLGADGLTLEWDDQWCRGDVDGIPPARHMDTLQNFPWLRERLASGGAVHVGDVAALPRAALAEKALWLRHETRSTLTVPLVSGGSTVGLLVFHSVRSPGDWRSEDINLLETLAGVLATAWQRRRDLEALRQEEENVRLINAELELRVTRATAGLRSSEARYRRLIESLGDSYIFYSHDTAGRLTYLSPSSRDLLGYGDAGEVGTAISEWLRQDPRNRNAATRLAKTRRGQRQEVLDLYARHANGREMIFELDAVPVFDADGKVVSVEGVARDVTRERRNAELVRQAQERLVEADKLSALTAMVAGMSHEISTPVGVGVTAASHLSDLAESARSAYNDGLLTGSQLECLLADMGETAGSIHANLERTADLLRTVRQVTVDQCTAEEREFDLAGALEDIVRSLRPRLRGTGFGLRLDCAPGIKLLADAGSLYRIVANLVTNSLVHGFEGRLVGTITLRAEIVAGSVAMTYTDDGNGMNRDQLARLYDPFYTTRRGRGGMGLGMHIVYTNATQVLGGSVTCHSRPGKGMTMALRFPLRREADHG